MLKGRNIMQNGNMKETFSIGNTFIDVDNLMVLWNNIPCPSSETALR